MREASSPSELAELEGALDREIRADRAPTLSYGAGVAHEQGAARGHGTCSAAWRAHGVRTSAPGADGKHEGEHSSCTMEPRRSAARGQHEAAQGLERGACGGQAVGLRGAGVTTPGLPDSEGQRQCRFGMAGDSQRAGARQQPAHTPDSQPGRRMASAPELARH